MFFAESLAAASLAFVAALLQLEGTLFAPVLDLTLAPFFEAHYCPFNRLRLLRRVFLVYSLTGSILANLLC